MLTEKKGGRPHNAYPPHPEGLPTGLIQYGSYRVRFATTQDELDTILRLRYRVFNLELGEGLEESDATGRDEDPFDRQCHHLLVEHEPTHTIIGTYRIQTAAMAESGDGFYSHGEFDLTALPPAVMDRAIEIGRACISREHRNRQVLFLLWKGLARYLLTNDKRFLFGCCSLNSQDGAEGLRVLRYLEREGHMHPEIEIPPQAGLECDEGVVAPSAMEEAGPVDLPALFKTYLRYGSKVCGAPAIDRAFRTIDFFVLFDVQGMDPRTYRLFFEG
ncbi:MAG: GNAT family N-acyltransferase [Acidobacteriota bacterium]